MGSIFSRVYGGMLLACFLIAIATFFGMSRVNEWRFSSYLDEMTRGTFTLIAAGASRHEGEKRMEWLNAIRRLTELELSVVSREGLDLSKRDEAKLIESGILIKLRSGDELALIYVKLMNSNTEYLTSQLSDINEPLSRVTALLILNELGRVEKHQRKSALLTIQKDFGFPISRTPIHETKLNHIQKHRIIGGDTVVLLQDAVTEDRAITVYAPYGNSGDVLVLGPISLFNWYPKELLVALGFLILSIMAFASYLSVRPLESRLKRMAKEIISIGTGGNLPMVDANGNDAISHLARHINEMSQQINSLLENQRELTLAVSHDLKTPVARIKFRLTELEDAVELKYIPAETIQSTVSGIQRDINQLESLLEEMLNYANLDQDSLVVEKIDFELANEISILCNEYSVTHPQLTLIPPSATFWVRGNHLFICRAIENLLNNACRYAKSRVTISAAIEDEKYVVYVMDDGKGIPENLVLKIFEPFFRVDSSRNNKFGGTGLGLSIVCKIASIHQGKVEALPNNGGAIIKLEWPKSC